MIPTGWQIRQGREMIGISQAALAEAAGVGVAVVTRAELAAYMPTLTRRDSASIQEALEAAGVDFVRRDSGVGVQLRTCTYSHCGEERWAAPAMVEAG